MSGSTVLVASCDVELRFYRRDASRVSDLANWKRDPFHDWDYELGICKRCFVTIGEIRRREASAWCNADDGREVKGVVERQSSRHGTAFLPKGACRDDERE
jgi:hypothetical protein